MDFEHITEASNSGQQAVYNNTAIHRSQAVQDNFQYFTENCGDDDFLNSRQNFVEMVSTDEVRHADYVNTLLGNNGTDGLVTKVVNDPIIESNVRKVINRQREIYLEDINNGTLGVTDNSIAYAGASYPMLIDLYTDPTINGIATQHVINKQAFTFKRGWVSGEVENSNGTFTTTRLPSNNKLVRGETEEVTIPPGGSVKLFELSGAKEVNGRPITYRNTAINKSLFNIFELVISDDDNGAGGVSSPVNEHVIPIVIRPIMKPNARNTAPYKFTFFAGPEVANPTYNPLNSRSSPTIQDITGEEIAVHVHFSIDWEKGVINWTATFENLTDPATTNIYAPVHLKARVHYRPKEEKYNYVTAKFNQTSWDMDIDVKEMFRIPLHQEDLQDYKDMDNIDLLKTFTFHLNHQFKLNKDLDIATLLEQYIPEYERVGSVSYCNLDQFKTSGGNFTPDSMADVFKNIKIALTRTNSNIHKIFHAAPQTLIAGRGVAAVLANTNDMAYNVKNFYNNGNHGEGRVGMMSGMTSQYDYQKVIISDAIPSNYIYHVYKPASNMKEHTVMADIIYKPLYISEEIHETVKSIYMKSRTAIEITNPEGIGLTILNGHEDFFGNL